MFFSSTCVSIDPPASSSFFQLEPTKTWLLRLGLPPQDDVGSGAAASEEERWMLGRIGWVGSLEVDGCNFDF